MPEEDWIDLEDEILGSIAKGSGAGVV